MGVNGTGMTRRALLGRAAAVSLGAISARGAYGALEEMGLVAPDRAAAAAVRRREEQYLIESLEVILDNGVPTIIPPLYNDVITAKLAPGRTWTSSALKSAQSRLEDALKRVESPYPATAAGLTIVVAWGLPYFRTYVPSLWSKYAPVDLKLPADAAGNPQYAVIDAIRFPSDPAETVLEENHVSFKFRSDDPSILQSVEKALFEDKANRAYVGDLFQLTSKRSGFVGRGFGGTNVGKQFAIENNVAGAENIPDRSQLMLGFTSTQHAALGADNIASFETLPGQTNQWPSGYFAAGCAMHLSHLELDLVRWYADDYATRTQRMFAHHTSVPGDSSTVTLPNGPADVTSRQQLDQNATSGSVGHNETLQQATRLPVDVVDNYGRVRGKGTPIPVREDFNTIDNPFTTPSAGAAAAGLHFAVFLPATARFHTARKAMDGHLPDGTVLPVATENNGINAVMRATHRQNLLVPPRKRRSFPLVELLPK